MELIFGLLPEGKIIKKLSPGELTCKGIPLVELSQELAADLIKGVSGDSEEIILGAALSGKELRLLNGKVQFEKIPFSQVLDHLQSRILISGQTGSGKTVWANLFQRQIMECNDYLEGGVVSITRDVDNLSNAGSKFSTFSPESSLRITLTFSDFVKNG